MELPQITPDMLAVRNLVGRLIKIRRGELGLSQRKLAALVGVSAFTVLQWEKGRHLPSSRILPRLREVLDSDIMKYLKQLTEKQEAIEELELR